MSLKESQDPFQLGLSKPVVVLKESESIRNAASAMCRNEIGCVVVMGIEGRVSGLITDRDIACRCVADAIPYHSKIALIMDPEVVSVSPDSSLEEVVALMKERGIRRIPVITEGLHGKQKCEGIFTLDHLVYKNLIDRSDYREILRAQIKLRQSRKRSDGVHSGRSEAIYERFISNMARSMGIKRKLSEELIHYLLKSIVQRLHYSGSSQLISQLPSYLHEDLYGLKAGPDRSITEAVIVDKVSSLLGVHRDQSKQIIHEFWRSLCQQIGNGETGDVIDQLPQELKELFQGKPSLQAMS